MTLVAKRLEAAADPANSHLLKVGKLETEDVHHVLRWQ